MPHEEQEELEWKTRRSRVDPRLRRLGWNIVPFAPDLDPSACSRHAVTEFPTSNGPADYALILDGRIVGIVEAKKLSLGPQNVLTQAERYACGLEAGDFNFNGRRAPFLYSTNGEIIWFHDVRYRASRSRQVADFHTPAALREMLARDFSAECAGLKSLPNSNGKLRPYQREANAAIETAIADRKRTMLIAMATGTGKTFTMVNQVYRLMKFGVGRRVLFLVDRRALAAQAVREFVSFEAEPGLKFDKIYEVYSQRFQKGDLEPDEKFDPKVMPNAYLTDPKPGMAFAYVCTIQRMARYLFPDRSFGGRYDEDENDLPEPLPIPIHAFDLIIADECHRGYTAAEQSLWRDTLDHFDAVKLGLTATPAQHTTAYFRDIIYRYDYRRAIDEGYLVDYDAIAMRIISVARTRRGTTRRWWISSRWLSTRRRQQSLRDKCERPFEMEIRNRRFHRIFTGRRRRRYCVYRLVRRQRVCGRSQRPSEMEIHDRQFGGILSSYRRRRDHLHWFIRRQPVRARPGWQGEMEVHDA